jgi:uncharacterized protein YdiU (UPF0061 family)
VHGVMNTDNMSVLGLTIDYGPYGWLDNFDPDWTPNTTDAVGKRYRFGHQPDIAMWNLMQFGNALYPLIEQAEPLQAALDSYGTHFRDSWTLMMRGKLGLGDTERHADTKLISDLLALLTSAETDMMIFFRRLADVQPDALIQSENSSMELLGGLQDAYYAPDELPKRHLDQTLAWLRRYAGRVRMDGTPDAARRDGMNRVNPKYVLRNYLAQLAVDSAEKGDPSLVHELLEMARRPYDEQPGMEDRAGKRPDWARSRAGCSMLSCSS